MLQVRNVLRIVKRRRRCRPLVRSLHMPRLPRKDPLENTQPPELGECDLQLLERLVPCDIVLRRA